MAVAGAVWLPILPDMSRFNRQVRAGAGAGMAAAGKTAGRSYGTAATSAVKGAGISRAMAAETQAGAAASARAIEQQTGRMNTARNRAANAAGTLRTAEARLTQLRASGKATTAQLVAAEERVAKAQRNVSTTSAAAAGAQSKLVSMGQATQRATQGVAAATNTATASTGRFGRLGAAAMSRVRSGVWSVASTVPAVGNFAAGLRSSSAAASALTGRAGMMGGAVRSAFGRVQSGVSTAIGGFSRFGASIGRATSRARASIRGVGVDAAGLGAVAGFALLGRSAVTAAVNIDNTRRTLTGLYGSASAANDMMGRLAKLSRSSPISYKAYADASTQLAYMGIKGREAEGVLRNVGAAIVASGKGSEAMGQASNAMLQMVNSGKVYADQLNQISQAGVPVFSALAKHFNTNIGNVREMVTKGKVGIQDVMASIRNAEGPTFQSMLRASKQVTGSMSNQWAIFKNQATLALGQIALPILTMVLPPLQMLAGFLSRHKTTAALFGIALGSVAAALAIVTIATWAFNSSLLANPITWVVAAVIALVGVIVYLATQTRFFQIIWNGLKVAFWAVGAAAMWLWRMVFVPVGQGIMWALRGIGAVANWLWWNVLSPVFSFIGLAARVLVAIIVTVLVTPIVLIFRLWAAVAMWLWNVAIHPVFTWIGHLATWLWVNALAPAFRGIAWVFRWLYTAVILPVGHFIGAVFRWLYYNAVLPVARFVQAALRAVAAVFRWLYYNVVLPVGHFIANIFRWLWANVINPTCTYIKAGLRLLGAAFSWVYNNVIHPVWNALGAAIRWVWVNVIRPAFNAVKAAVAAVGRAFSSAVGFIERVWNKIKAIAAKPINFVINTVYNHGIKAVWDKVAGFLGLGKLPAAKPVRWATGGHVTGPGTGTSDEIPALLSNGEFVVREKVASFARPFLHALNSGNAEALQATGGPRAKLPGYRRGGPVRANTGSGADAAIQRGLAAARSYNGKPYIWGGVGPRGVDCSGMISVVTNALRGEGNIHHRLGVARSQPWPGFARGINGAWATGWKSTHTAGTLAGTNIESAKSPIVFPGRHGADRGDFTGHAHLPIVGGRFVSGGGGDGGGFISWIVNKILDPIRGLIKRTLPERPLWKSMPRGASLKLVDGVANWLSSKDTSGTGAPGSGPVVNQVRGVANGFGWGQGPQWDALSWIISHESGWNPNAKNPTSSAHGLFQFLDSTWSQYGGFTPNPAQQARAGLGYIRSRYHDPLGAKRFWQAHHWYDQGGILPPGVNLAVNGTGQDEMVLTRRQWQALEANVRGGDDGPSVVVNNNNTYKVEHSPEEHAAAASREIARAVRTNR